MTPRTAGGEPAVPFGALDLSVAAAMNILWGMNIIAMKVTVGALAPFTAGAARLAIVGLICAPWMRPPQGRVKSLALFGLITGGLFLLFLNLALKVSTNVGALAIVGQMAVPIALVLGAVILKERMSRAQLAGIAVAIVGIVVLMFDPRIFGELPGLLLMLLAATMWGTSSLVQRQLAGVPVLTLYFWTGLMGTALLLPMSLVLEPGVLAKLPGLPAAPLAWLAFSVLGATLAGQGGMAWLLGRHPLSAVMPLTLAAPVVSVAASHWMFGTPVTASMVIGGLMTLAGVVIVTMARRRALKEMGA
ncbi:DMT family transporter [Sphingomonas montanisoli]|nr:EamA family transporter [Sphingomonas montanisoli]